MEAILKVTPAQLINTANEFSSIGNTVSSLTADMMEKMTNLGGIYESEEATAYITKARGLEDDIAKLNGMITEHVSDLNEMAQRYETAGTGSAGLIESLSSDVII